MISFTNDPNTLVLLHGDDFADSSMYNRTVENHGVSTSTATSKFGDSSFYFNGSSWMKVDVSGGAKTVDFWLYTNLAQTSGIYQTPFSLVLSGVRTYMHVDDSTGGAYPIYRVIHSGSVIGGNGSTIITRGVWHHIAYCTDGQGNHRFYLDGVLQKSISRTIGEYVHLIMGVAADYGDTLSNNTYFTGYIDEIRVSDIERWTENFTPPTAPYVASTATITSGGIIPQKYALRRRMMVGSNAPFAFEYTGNYTDNRDANGIGTVEFTSSGTLTILSGKATVPVYILAGGGGAARCTSYSYDQYASGGGGGNQNVTVELVPGTYQITIGTGGAFKSGTDPAIASNGGNSSAFGYTSTGGNGARAGGSGIAGSGGSPNGGNGNANNSNCAGGFPNGGAVSNGMPFSGGNGIVRLTFS